MEGLNKNKNHEKKGLQKELEEGTARDRWTDWTPGVL